jgi:phosphatidylglycerophosphatase A
MKKNLLYAAGSVLGCGYIPIAPGTFGSLAAVLAIYFISPATEILISSIIFIFFTGVYISYKIEKEKGHDAQIIVIDEFAGQCISLLFLPDTVLFLFLAFVLFRFFDILKPFPINKSQSLPGGWGVMTDDVIAGLYSNLILHFILFSGLLS